MFIGIFGALLFLSSVVWLLFSLFKKMSIKLPLILILVGFVLFVYGLSIPEPVKEVESKKETPTEESTKKEVTPKEWVEAREGGNFDTIMKDYELLTDQEFKDTVNAGIADEESTIFNKKVEVTGTVLEFLQPETELSKRIFMLKTDAGNIVRVSCTVENEGLDVGEKVDVTGKVGMSIDKGDDQFIKDALAQIVIN